MDHPNIEERKFSFCPSLSELDLDNLIVQCPSCTDFFTACCPHKSFGGDMNDPEERVCHHLQLVFTDGACSNNGQGYEKAGLRIVIGDDDFWSITVDDTLDTGLRMNQCAEMLAAIKGLKKMEQLYQSCSNEEAKVNHRKSAARRCANAMQDYCATYIIVTDLEYVVKGITQWFPEW
jgi:ribonuclease HI